MWDLLVTKTNSAGDKVIGMGENLASVLIASCSAMPALPYIMSAKDAATVDASLNALSDGLNACYQNDEI
jgi:hypothetical protein